MTHKERVELFLKNRGLAHTQAFKYFMASGAGDDDKLNEFIQVGYVGLWRATQDFSKRKARFSTYGTIWVKQALSQYRKDSSHLIKIPSYMQEKKFLSKKGRKAELHQQEGLRAMREHKSLTDPVFDSGGVSIQETIDSKEILPDELALSKSNRAEILSAVKALPPKERSVIMGRFGMDGKDPLTMQEIAKKKKYSRAWVCFIEQRAIKRLYYKMLKLGYNSY